MPHLNLIVQFRTFTNSGISCNSFIYGTQSSYIHMIFYDNTTTRLQLIEPLWSVFIVKSTGSQNRSSMYGYMVSNNSIVINTDIGMNDAMITNGYIITNKAIRLNDGLFSYFG